MIFIFDTLRKIKNYFTDAPQEPETIFKPLAKIEQPRKVTMNFKTKTIEARSNFMNILLYEIMQDMFDYARVELGIEAVVTETVTTPEEDKSLDPPRKSVSHQQGRAFDLRTAGWRLDQIKKFENHFVEKYGKHGAISPTTGQPNLIVHHQVGYGPHFHVQIHSKYTVADLQKTLKERGVA